MEISLGVLRCLHCGSERLHCCEMADDLKSREVEDWDLRPIIPDYVKENLANDPYLNLLVNCLACQRWFMVTLRGSEIGTSELPIGKKTSGLESPILILDPSTQDPASLYVGGFSLKIEEYSIERGARPTGFIEAGPFYPYPLGAYSLICTALDPANNSAWQKIDLAGKAVRLQQRGSFRCILVGSPPSVVDSATGDLAFYTLGYKWIDDHGADILHLLTEAAKTTKAQSVRLASVECLSESLETQGQGFRGLDPMTELEKALDKIYAPQTIADHVSRVAWAARRTQAYRFISWLELELRGFIWKAYESRYAEQSAPKNWWKGCFPENVRSHIATNQERAERLRLGNLSQLPLDYADFDDLWVLMQKEWSVVTRGAASNQAAAQGHFEYVKHFRNAIAHGRPLGHADLMNLQDHAGRFAALVGASFLDGMEVPFYRAPRSMQ